MVQTATSDSHAKIDDEAGEKMKWSKEKAKERWNKAKPILKKLWGGIQGMAESGARNMLGPEYAPPRRKKGSGRKQRKAKKKKRSGGKTIIIHVQ
jgi:hypothetical protein